MSALPGTPLTAPLAPTRDDHAALKRRLHWRMTFAMTVAHLVGVFDVVALLVFILPGPSISGGAGESLLIAGAIYLPLSWGVGAWLGTRNGRRRFRWLTEGRRPTDEERAAVLRAPMACTLPDLALWFGAVVVSGAVLLPSDPDLAIHVMTTIGLGGLSTCTVAYLVAERVLHPATAEALRFGPPPQPVGLGVKGRLVLAWVMATGVPVLGIILVACHALAGDVSAERTALAVTALAIAALGVGLLVTYLTAHAVATPLGRVRRALAAVEAGDLSASVRVDDGSEVGLVQSGFNRMAAGLRERERLRDLYGRHVGEDMARVALDHEPALGGEVREVAVLFVDLCGSTTMASQRPPGEVVAILNAFFAVVVEVVEGHGGWVNKFEGDAAMCVFGAPAPRAIEESSSAALAAARDLRERLADLGAEAGIGVSAGPAVAGWIGAMSRMEYTVIGDPVNEAARLCELAKRRDERVLCSGAVLSRAGVGEQARWQRGESLVLRGRNRPTRVAAPA